MDGLWQDLRYGVRALFKTPAFAVVALLTLAIGIGANTAMFSLLNQVLWHTLPYPEPERLVHIDWRSARGVFSDALNAPQTKFINDNNRSFESVAIEFPGPGCNLSGTSKPEFVSAATVSPGYFHVLGIGPMLGREFVADDVAGVPETPGSWGRLTTPQSTILSYGLWQRLFAGDRAVLGRQVSCNGQKLAIVGVLPQSFRYTESVDMFLPDLLSAHMKDTGGNYGVIARLKEDVALPQAQQEMNALASGYLDMRSKALGRTFNFPSPPTFGLMRYDELITGGERKPLLLLFGAVGLVLLIACANIAGLMLARTSSRGRELAIRAALGARRSRLFSQLLNESMVLNLAGGAAGLLLALWAINSINWYVAEHYPSAGEARLSPLVLLFALGASLLSGILTGTAPALHSSRTDLGTVLRQGEHGSASGAQRRFRKLLVVAEVAVAIVLLTGSALLVRSFVRLQNVALGFEARGVQVAEFSLASDRYATTASVARFSHDLLEKMRGVPGITGAATITSTPMHRDLNLNHRDVCQGYSTQYRAVSPGYFAVIESRVLRGREFTAQDTSPVALVNEIFLKHCGKGRELIGSTLPGLGDDVPRQIVGVVEDTHEWGLSRDAWETVYVPQSQVPDITTRFSNQVFHWSLVLRTQGTINAQRVVEQALQQVDPQEAAISVKPLTELVSGSVASSRLATELAAAFAGVALLLTAIGLYGLLMFHVTQRTREIGIRMALGAAASNVLGMIVREGMLLVLVGTAAGMAAAFAAARLLRNLLFEVGPSDPLAFGAAAVFVLVITLAASTLPARRAARIDPMAALRNE